MEIDLLNVDPAPSKTPTSLRDSFSPPTPSSWMSSAPNARPSPSSSLTLNLSAFAPTANSCSVSPEEVRLSLPSELPGEERPNELQQCRDNLNTVHIINF